MEVKSYGRRSGRTTRMLEKAREAVKRGEDVVIMAHDIQYAKRLASQVPGSRPISLRNAEKLLGSASTLYIDHYAISILCGDPKITVIQENRIWDIVNRFRAKDDI